MNGVAASVARAAAVDGVHLANARGVTGSLGAVARGQEGRRVVLTAHHVLFGKGALEGDAVWARPDSPLAPLAPLERIGRAAGGAIGRVDHGGALVFVDCAVVLLDERSAYSEALGDAIAGLPELREARGASVGGPVTKLGAVSGLTEGVVADIDHYDKPFLDGQSYEAPGQILITPRPQGHLFSAPGDSGAALVDGSGGVVGLMWGCSPGGEGMACPIAPILDELRLEGPA